MSRDLYLQNLTRLETETLDLGHVVANEILEAVGAFITRDDDALRAVVTRDKRINAERLDIESRVLMMIATQQPVAVDMRLLAALLEVVTEVERIGDYAKGICKIGRRLGPAPVAPVILNKLTQMSEECNEMMRQALEAFAARDAEAARQLILRDDVVDNLYKDVFRTVVALGAKDDLTLERSNQVLWVAHNLERTADRVTNICERCLYVVTGELVSGKKSAMETRLSSVAATRAPDVPGADDVDPDEDDAAPPEY